MFQNKLKEILTKITEIEYKLQNYRQLLNEEIQFNLKDLYLAVCKDTSITSYHLYQFMESFPQQIKQNSGYQSDMSIKDKQSPKQIIQQIESMIRGYNNNSSLNLTFIEFSLIFLSKQNHLLSKLTLQRKSLGNLPFYLRNYARKILLLEAKLHQILIEFRKRYSNQMELWIKQHTIINQNNQKQLDDTILRTYSQELGIQINLLLQNFKLLPKQKPKYERIITLFTLKNSESIQKFIKRQSISEKYQTNPYVRPQFNDCLDRQIPKIQQISNFSHRQLKSVQKHMQRIQIKSPHKVQLSKKIKQYRLKVQNCLKQFCKHLKEIIQKQRQLQFHRIQLALCTDFYPILFFNSFQKDYHKSDRQTILPSTLQQYLQDLGIKIKLEDIFLLFKRFSIRVDGKLTFDQFCHIFDLSHANRKYYNNIQKNREIKSLNDVNLQTKKLYLTVLRETIKTQKNIEKIKYRLCHDNLLQLTIDFREIFSCIDTDEDGFISQTDFRILFKKFLNYSPSKEDICLIWHRIKMQRSKASQNTKKPQLINSQNTEEMIPYEKFVSQMLPKTKSKLNCNKNQKKDSLKIQGNRNSKTLIRQF